MADVKWIKICTDLFDDEKILMIESLPSADTIIVIWFKLLTFAGKQNNDGVFLMNNRIAYTDEMLATIFRRDINVVRLALKTFEDFGMIEIVSNVITIPNWNKHQTLDAYEKKKERDRLYQQSRREKQRLLVTKSSDNQATQSSYVAVSEEDIEEDIEEDNTNSASDNAPSVKKSDINNFFESIWKLYPNKKGKGQISDSKKKTLYDVGMEEMTRAIERYKSDLAKEEWRKPQN
jgi:predicted phage replisome organizer